MQRHATGLPKTARGPYPSLLFIHSIELPHFFFTGFKTLKLHIRVSSIDIMAPALSNSPPHKQTALPCNLARDSSWVR